MDYNEILERMADNESITNEEWDFVIEKLKEKLANGKTITAYEISDIILEAEVFMESTDIEPTRHGWYGSTEVFSLDGENYYSFVCWRHDDYGMDGIDDQVCPRMVKKQVLVEKWVEE